MHIQSDVIAHGGTFEKTPNTTTGVSYWVVPNGCDYSNAYIENVYFSNADNAQLFAKKWTYPPEMALCIDVKETNHA